MTEDNRRDFTRVPLTIHAEVTAGEKRIVSDQTRDLSMTGIFVCCDEPLPLEAVCDVRLLRGEPGSGMEIDARGQIVRSDSEGMGIEFTDIVGTESYDHLRNLLLLHSSAQADQVEQEIDSHLGIRRQR